MALLLALTFCPHVASGGYWIARLVPLELEPGVALDMTPRLYPILRADVGSVAIGYAPSGRVGFAVGTKLTEPFLLPGFRLTYPPFYVYGTHGVFPGAALSQPVMTVFAGVGLQSRGKSVPYPYARGGLRAEWHCGPLSPAAEASYWPGLGFTISVGVGVGGWRALRHVEDE